MVNGPFIKCKQEFGDLMCKRWAGANIVQQNCWRKNSFSSVHVNKYSMWKIQAFAEVNGKNLPQVLGPIS